MQHLSLGCPKIKIKVSIRKYNLMSPLGALLSALVCYEAKAKIKIVDASMVWPNSTNLTLDFYFCYHIICNGRISIWLIPYPLIYAIPNLLVEADKKKM